MKIIKLNAIDSTNSFLKEMAVNATLDSFTVVTAKEQTSGRGQMKNKWISEAGKNLTFSVFVRFDKFKIENQKYLSFVVSRSVFEALTTYYLPKLAIKWPNDIMTVNKKICGVLIENSLQKEYITSSVIGIGVNVNQEIFNDELSKATSLKNILGKEVDLDELLNLILERLQENIQLLNDKEFSIIEENYLNVLYKKNIPSMFKTPNGELFMGKIIGVSQEGKLQLELDNETLEEGFGETKSTTSVKEFDLKEVSFA
ncbi:biotin--[acetyl-CoA-carboxylase] synthetase [Tenacibaculum holothuriorum]|uniref:Biotin--[acetyl-CoA-carboxylase] synthetase n=1 Tax=Tenacibaculum holothuriorum TaxID=1635173 RepID=A0A1Y2PBS4_9FLAO|nr:biotin--[acetyl-CoA-carboxylase] ligase [Tenacibaculum holothuriorum]OSY87922.1 biotin--[acetyl-CoA-carboxylase] synthetase [Tenacibaculum holothuriorum]